MRRGKLVKGVVLLSTLVLMSACTTHSEPKVSTLNKNFIDKPTFKVKEKREAIELTKLSTKLIDKKSWVPLKVEDEIEWNAESLLGLPYVWGATGPSSYDCSGFTRKIYGDVGIHLPRVSREQAKIGKFLKFNQLKKGDMVFFATKRNHPRKVTHVGIYLGNGNFIHASSGAKRVVICNFEKDKFYKRKFLWGRRVIQEQNHVASSEVKSIKSKI